LLRKLPAFTYDQHESFRHGSAAPGCPRPCPGRHTAGPIPSEATLLLRIFSENRASLLGPARCLLR
jgi:hypothetical protein